MKITRQTLLGLLAVFTFLGTVGIPVFTHTCQEDGIFRSYLIKTSMHCEGERIQKLPPCCALKLASYRGDKLTSDCCDERTDLFKLKLDFKNDYRFSLVWEFVPIQKLFFDDKDHSHINSRSLVANHYRPPPLQQSGSELLISYQVFRI